MTSESPSRRRFLASLAAISAGPLILSGCRSKTPATVKTPPLPKPVDVDDVTEDAALARPPVPTSEPIIRVRVQKVRTPGNLLRIGQENQWLRLEREKAQSPAVALYGPLLVSMEAGGWSITDGKGFRAAVDGREPLTIARMDDSAGPLLAVTDLGSPLAAAASRPASTMPASLPPAAAPPASSPKQYPGTLRLFARTDLDPDSPSPFAFDLVNHVPIETYLPGVLSGELYKTWHVQTHAAQSIAARSFAATEAAIFATRRHYDVSNTAASQMYVGAGHSKSIEAVKMTRGVMLRYEGLLVSGYYSSCCGGVAACAMDAIGSNAVNNVAPLQGRSGTDVCVGTPRYQWKTDTAIDLLSRRVNVFAQEKRNAALQALVRLADIAVTDRNANGRARQITLTDTRGRMAVVSAEDFRRAANYSGQGLNPPDKPLLSSNLSASFSRAAVTFEGFGFGHGVGLCQYGAEAQAKAGTDHRDIVKWYYPGAELFAAYA